MSKEDNLNPNIVQKEVPEKEKSSETITVKKEKLDALLNRLDRLESAASKAGLSRWDQAHRDKTSKQIKLNVIEGRVITAWNNMPKNVVEKNPKSGHWEEDQIIEVVYEDGKTDKMPYVIFVRRYSHIPAKVLKETVNYGKDVEEMGNYTFEVEADGKKYIVGSKFVN